MIDRKFTDLILVSVLQCFVCAASMAQAYSIKEVVLGSSGSPITQTIEPGDYKFRIRNQIPGKQYVFETTTKDQPIILPPPLSLPVPVPVSPSPAAAVNLCKQAIDKATAAANSAASEVAVADALKKAPLDFADAGCTEAEGRSALQALESATSRVLDGTFTVKRGQTFEIKVSRSEKEGVLIVGNYEFATVNEVLGAWVPFYGFNFIDSGDERYFASSNATTPPSFTITKLQDRADYAFAPSVYFMWMREENLGGFQNAFAWRKSDLFGGIAAGLGFDFDNPTVFLGYGIGWGHNVMINAGVDHYKEKRLHGKYSQGQVIAEELTDAQLTEETYKPRAYVGLAFRFGSNPFEK